MPPIETEAQFIVRREFFAARHRDGDPRAGDGALAMLARIHVRDVPARHRVDRRTAHLEPEPRPRDGRDAGAAADLDAAGRGLHVGDDPGTVRDVSGSSRPSTHRRAADGLCATGNDAARPFGSTISISRGGVPRTRYRVAARAAHAPVVYPVRSAAGRSSAGRSRRSEDRCRRVAARRPYLR